MLTVLRVEVPKLVPITYGKYRNRVTYEERDTELVTSVRALRRIEKAGGWDEERIEADAYITPGEARQIEGRRSAWKTPEIRTCIVHVSKNRKSLAGFLASGDREWDVSEKP